MRQRPNFKAAIFVAIVHFALGLGSALMGAAEATRPTGGNDGWLVPTYILTFPLTTIFEILHNREGFGFAGNILAMIVQSFCWGFLIASLFPPGKPER